MELAPGVRLVFKTEGPYSHFFGYYDKSPLDISGTRLLAHRVSFDGRDVLAGDTATIGYWNISQHIFTELGTTQAFNWQQGAMLQWLPPDYHRRIIYNDRQDNHFVSVIVDVISGERRVIPFPIYAVHPSGTFALGINFERLYFCRKGYCYQGVVNEKWDRPIHPEDGIYRIDLSSGHVTLLFSTQQIVDIAPQPEMESGYNWLDHIVWNPSGTRFAFLHRWYSPNEWLYDGDPSKVSEMSETEPAFASRLLTANQDGSDIFLFPDTRFYSHMGWRNDSQFTIWGRLQNVSQNPLFKIHRAGHTKKSRLAHALLWIYRWAKRNLPVSVRIPSSVIGNPAYLLITDKSYDMKTLTQNALNEDGHNTWHCDRNWMLTDTYPDSQQYQRLLMYSLATNQAQKLGRFFAPFSHGYRCDLHPRFDYSCHYVVVDSACLNQRRQIYVLDITNQLSK